MRLLTMVVMSAGLGLALLGCGSSAQSSTSLTGGSAHGNSTTASPGAAGASGGPGALSAEAQSVATGDIPDNQVFLTFRNRSAGYSISYPEGWSRKGASSDVTFSDKNNIVHILIGKAPAPSEASLRAELTKLRHSSPTLSFSAPTAIHGKAGLAIKATYTTRSAPNPVTGKRVLLIVDRYELARSGKRATVDLGTPKGVD